MEEKYQEKKKNGIVRGQEMEEKKEDQVLVLSLYFFINKQLKVYSQFYTTHDQYF